jgi:exodeoxyribonuclease V alpha subunit
MLKVFSSVDKKHQQAKLEFINGLVERITYHNEENGFAVLKVKVRGHRDFVTIVGNVPNISVGEEVQAQGRWFNDVNHGLQFKAEFIRSIPPTTLEGIEKYLGSGLIRGIGEYYAKKLVSAFKEEVFSIIEYQPEKLTTIEGIGKVRANSISKNWSEQKVVREIMLFLQSHAVGTSRATRIYKTYGEQAIKKVSENPYSLARDITGIGFLTADKIAKSLGIEENSIIRARAGINYVLTEALSSGHCGLPTELLLKHAKELLVIAEPILNQALIEELQAGHLIEDQIDKEQIIFLTGYYNFERNIATKLNILSKDQPIWNNINTTKAIEWVEQKLSIKLADKQKDAIRTVIKSKVTVITGGPGTGKTTLLNSILKILTAKQYKVKLCAPTGRAAKRLSESTNTEACTIHRLLQYDPKINKFKYNQDHPLDCQLLVIDEASMVDVQLLNSLLKAIPNTSGLIIVGDVDQLPSVGPGQILKDIIDSNTISTIKLIEIFRQGKNSNIIINAHLVNKGMFPKLQQDHNDKTNDFFFIEANTPEEIIDKVVRFVKYTIPARFKLNSIIDTQVLCPMQRGGCGARSLNIELQKALNPNHIQAIEKYGQLYSIGDKVMQMENNYDKDVYNGDMGFITKIDHQEQQIIVSIDNKPIIYSFDELDELSISYATTIHKSQGSEYSVAVIPVTTQHFTMLQKNLLYTAITRGRKLVVLIGQKKAIAIAVKSNKEVKRYTKLKEWLINL